MPTSIIAKRIREQRRNKNMSLNVLAEKIGVSGATLQRYESGVIKNVKREIITELSAALGCSEAYLLGVDEKKDFDNVLRVQAKRLPILGKIACGNPIFCDSGDNGECVLSHDTNADFCLVAKGDSMINARIYDGDIVLIKSQSDVENGEIAAVVIEDEATLKRVYKVGSVITLMPANPKYTPLVYTPEEFKNIRILGKAVGMQTNNLYIEKE